MNTTRSDTIRTECGSPDPKRPAMNMGDTRETIERLRVVAGEVGTLRTVVDARIYMGRSSGASTVYASVWIRHATSEGAGWSSGRGRAGGYGYHKASAALGEALAAAGFTFYQGDRRWDMHGAGETAMREGLLAVARAVGETGPLEVL